MTSFLKLMWGAQEAAGTVTGNGKSNASRGTNHVTSTANDATNMYLYWAIQERDRYSLKKNMLINNS